MVDKQLVDSLLVQLAAAVKSGNADAMSITLTELLNAVPGGEMQSDIGRINLDEVAAALDSGKRNGKISSAELTAFAKNPAILNEALSKTHFAGDVFKTTAQAAFVVKDVACKDPAAYEAQKDDMQKKLNLVPNLWEWVAALAVKAKLNDMLQVDKLTADGEWNRDLLASKSTELMQKFKEIRLPEQEELCESASASPVTPPAKPREKQPQRKP